MRLKRASRVRPTSGPGKICVGEAYKNTEKLVHIFKFYKELSSQNCPKKAKTPARGNFRARRRRQNNELFQEAVE